MKLYPCVIALVNTSLLCVTAVGQPHQTPSISMGIVLDTSGSMGYQAGAGASIGVGTLEIDRSAG